MADAENTPPATTSESSSLSISRVGAIVIPIAVVLVGIWLYQKNQPAATKKKLESDQLSRLLAQSDREPLEGWTDSDGDLLPDAPPADEGVAPEKLVFSYVASKEPSETELQAWQPFLDALAEKTGLPTEATQYETVPKQLSAMAAGELHVTAFNTGAVPSAVTTAGFIPVCTLGSADGFGYKMKLLVKADSEIQDTADLKGKRVMFVRPNSNSGFKAAFSYLMNEQQMLAGRDYEYGFSMGHDLSIKELLAGHADAAPVASDLFDRLVKSGEVSADAIRVIYESNTFPPVALGYAYNLKPELRDTIKQTFLDFTWEGTPLAESYGASGRDRFVPVDYKTDWEIVRDIDEQLETLRKAQ
ncbi:phosphate/phosphite/phosphonate ABC transporter substrate-binding protein [Aeoliella mucimassa]|uniref:Phosphate-import protein PhnD n=1 Tax=Aeoliella mucimassa TaxID=2527972 RepID=A0A518AUV7_9BACT|nr:phosphate/phosphite/phosphonate ABC transporter substrate-binding protein [Aeoliella mucimassa]QDU58498.1 Phosphate-import protein PhnD precursor [Aeoliella mucimassa]